MYSFVLSPNRIDSNMARHRDLFSSNFTDFRSVGDTLEMDNNKNLKFQTRFYVCQYIGHMNGYVIGRV